MRPIDPRFTQEAGPIVFSGNELLVKGALETEGGVHLLTGYPGSPIAAFCFWMNCRSLIARYWKCSVSQWSLASSILPGPGSN